MTENLSMKRLSALDAMRGLSILGMIPMHMFLFGALWLGGGWGSTGGSSATLSVVTFDKPLATGLIIFFFVTGVSLTLSLARRQEKQSFSEMARHVILRYGGYAIIGIFFELIMWIILYGGQINLQTIVRLLPAIIAGATFSGPIIGIGLTAIVAFPLILKLSWKKLLTISSVLAPIVGVVLYYVLLPQYSSLPQGTLLNPVIIEGWSILKSLPLMLIGAAVGKLVLAGRDIKKPIIIIGAAICFAYAIIPTLLGSGMLHIVLAMWAYPHAILFTISSSLFMFGLFRILEARNYKLNAVKVLGRSPVLVYYGHFILFLTLFMLVGENMTMGVLGGLMLFVIAVVWILSYLYSKWRFGPPSSW